MKYVILLGHPKAINYAGGRWSLSSHLLCVIIWMNYATIWELSTFQKSRIIKLQVVKSEDLRIHRCFSAGIPRSLHISYQRNHVPIILSPSLAPRSSSYLWILKHPFCTLSPGCLPGPYGLDLWVSVQRVSVAQGSEKIHVGRIHLAFSHRNFAVQVCYVC